MKIIALYICLASLVISCISQERPRFKYLCQLKGQELEIELRSVFQKGIDKYSAKGIDLFYYEDHIRDAVKHLSKESSPVGDEARHFFEKNYPDESVSRKSLVPCTPVLTKSLDKAIASATSQVDKSMNAVNQRRISRSQYMNRNRNKAIVILSYSRGGPLAGIEYAMFFSKTDNGWILLYGDLFGES